MHIIRSSTLLFQSGLAVILGGGTAIIGMQVTPMGAWLGLVPVLLILGMGLRRPLRRWVVAHRTFPPPWRTWLSDHVPFYTHLDFDGQHRFERDIQFFLDEQTFEAVEGADVTEEIRLGTAAGAALLLHGRPDWEWSTNRTILIYPDRFDEDYYGGRFATYDGMVHAQGPIILSARAVEESWAHPQDGSNVVLHELAHLFDFDQDGAVGVPSLMEPSSAATWRQLVQKEMQRVRAGTSMLRDYAATNPAEFFAVAVENFFERPRAMQRRHPALYNALKSFFNLDPLNATQRSLEP